MTFTSKLTPFYQLIARPLRRLTRGTLLLGGLTIPLAGQAQLALTSAAPTTETFDGLGTTAAGVVPAGFMFSAEAAPTYASAANYSALTQASNGNNFTSGGTYNLGANPGGAGFTDRALGFLSSGSYLSPRHILLEIRNATGTTLQDVQVQFDLEKYRTGTRSYDWKFYTSIDGITWTAQPAGDQNYPADATSNTYYSSAATPPLTVSKTVSVAGVNVPSNGAYYLRWSYVGLGGSTNAQGLGLDNVTITPTLAGGTPPPTAVTITTGSVAPTSFCVTPSVGSSAFDVAFTSTGTLAGPYAVQLSNANGVFPINTDANLIGTGSNSPLTATIPAGTPSGSGYRVRVVQGATIGTDNGTDFTVTLTPASNVVTVAPASAQTVIPTGTGATLTAAAAAGSTFAWQSGPSATGPFTPIAGATAATYQLRGADFAGAGTYFLVAQATVTTGCGTSTGTSDPIAVTVTAPAPTPALTVSLTSLPDFDSVIVNAASAAKSFTVSGDNLTGPITITPPAGFEIRAGSTAFACCAIVLAPVNGTVPATSIDVRLAPTASQAYQATIPLTSPGLPDQSVAVAGTGTPAVYPATLATAPITELTSTSATTGGLLATDGGSPVTARGVVWSTTRNPTTSLLTKTTDGAGTDPFASRLTGLLPGTTYFVRAYATNATSAAYGEELTFTTVAVPLAAEPTAPATLTASQVTSTTLQLNLSGGDGQKRLVIARLGSPVDATPTDATTYLANATFGQGSQLGKGSFVVYNGRGDSLTLTGLRPNTPYYFTVFAFNDNETPYAENYLTTVPGTLTQSTLAAPAALLLEENFDYAAGALLTANNWVAHSGAGTRAVAVAAAGLSYSGYGAASGNAAAIIANGEDVNRTFEPVYARTPVYASFLVKVNSASTAGDYFLHLAPRAIGSTFRSRVSVRRDAATGQVQFGISGGTGAVTYTTEQYALNTTYLLVVKYSFDEAGSVSQLFINPATDTEPATASATATETGSTPAAPNDNIGSVALRQGANSPNLVVDGIRVGTSYRVVKTGFICLPPAPAFTAAAVCAGTPTMFTDVSTTVEAGATYAWDVDGDDTTDYTTAGNVSHQYAAAGTYAAKLTITQGACSESFTRQVTVWPLPTATLSGTATVCAGTSATLSVQLTGTAPWVLTYSADGGATSTALPITAADVDAEGSYPLAVTPAETTTYSLVTLTDAHCTSAALTGAATITVTTPPVLAVPANLTATTPADQCSAPVSFAAPATGAPAPGVSYSIVQDGGPVTITSPYCFPVGTTTVTATATNRCGTATQTFTVTVRDEQAPTVQTQPLTVALVNGTATITPAQVDNGSFDACGIVSLSLSQTTFSCANIGSNTVTLIVTDGHGNTASQPATVTVTGTVPTPAIVVTPTSNVYTGGVPTTLYLGYGPQSATLTASGGISYQWSPATGLSNAGSANPVFTATMAGTFTFTVTATSASGCAATKSLTLTVRDVRCGNKNDNVSVCHQGKALCIGAEGVADHLHHGDQLGDCAAPATAKGAAIAASARSAADSELLLEAYPNPFTEQTTLRFRPSTSGPARLQLYNALGQVVKTLYDGSAQAGQLYQLPVEGATLPQGLYTGRLQVDGQVQTLRLLLSK